MQVYLHIRVFKVVICGKYINLNKITKKITYLPEIQQISYFCCSLQFTMYTLDAFITY